MTEIEIKKLPEGCRYCYTDIYGRMVYTKRHASGKLFTYKKGERIVRINCNDDE